MDKIPQDHLRLSSQDTMLENINPQTVVILTLVQNYQLKTTAKHELEGLAPLDLEIRNFLHDEVPHRGSGYSSSAEEHTPYECSNLSPWVRILPSVGLFHCFIISYS